jgi:putative molybdopterin biosynthesis protein
MNRTPEPDPYLTVIQIAEEMGLSDQTVYNWIKEKRLPATKIGRALRVRRSDLERVIEAHSTTAPASGEDAFWGDPDAQRFQPPGRSG